MGEWLGRYTWKEVRLAGLGRWTSSHSVWLQLGLQPRGALELRDSSEMEQIESKGFCIPISCIPGKRYSHGQSDSLRAVPTDGQSYEWSRTNIPSRPGISVSGMNRREAPQYIL